MKIRFSPHSPFKHVRCVFWSGLCLLLIQCAAHAQDSTATRFNIMGLEGGIGLNRYHDPVEMTLPQRAGSFSTRFSWLTLRPRHADAFSFSYSNTNTTPLDGTQGSDHRSQNFLINYAFYFPLWKKSNTQLFLGPSTVFNVAVRELNYATGETSENHEFFVALQASAMLKVDFDKNFLIAGASLPLLALVTERKYALRDLTSSDLLGFSSFRSAMFNAVYYHQIKGALYLNLGYHLYSYSYARHDALPDTKNNRHQWLTGLQFQFVP